MAASGVSGCSLVSMPALRSVVLGARAVAAAPVDGDRDPVLGRRLHREPVLLRLAGDALGGAVLVMRQLGVGVRILGERLLGGLEIRVAGRISSTASVVAVPAGVDDVPKLNPLGNHVIT